MRHLSFLYSRPLNQRRALQRLALLQPQAARWEILANLQNL